MTATALDFSLRKYFSPLGTCRLFKSRHQSFSTIKKKKKFKLLLSHYFLSPLFWVFKHLEAVRLTVEIQISSNSNFLFFTWKPECYNLQQILPVAPHSVRKWLPHTKELVSEGEWCPEKEKPLVQLAQQTCKRSATYKRTEACIASQLTPR